MQPGQVQQGSGEGSGGLGAEPGQVHQGPEKVRFNSVPEKVQEKVWEALAQSRKVWEALVQSQVRFNRVPKKVPEKEGLGGFGAKPGQVQQGSGEGSGEGSRKPWCKAKPGSTGSGEGSRLAPQHASERFEKKNVAAVGDSTEAYFWI